jgi:hypothetical protein
MDDIQRLYDYCESLKAKINFLQQEVFDLRREVAALREVHRPSYSVSPSPYDLTQGNKGAKGLKK